MNKDKESVNIDPVWLRINDAAKLTSIGRAKLYQLIPTECFKTVTLRAEGQRHATRLIEKESLLAWIESFVGK